MLDVLAHIVFKMGPEVLPLQDIHSPVNAVVAAHRVVVVLTQNGLAQSSVFGNPHFPAPTQDATGVDFPYVVTLPRLACSLPHPRFMIEIGLVSLLNLTDVVKEAVWYFQCVSGFTLRRFKREVVRGGDATFTMAKETVSDNVFPSLSFRFASIDPIVFNSGVGVFAVRQRVVRVRRYA
jgi:hypothetical protein